MDEIDYVVVCNLEGQYSIWSSERAVPPGWVPEGTPACKEVCLEYIRARWVDMTPLSLRARQPRELA